MANLIQDPGFELDNGSWTETGNANILSTYAHSGSNSMRLQAAGIGGWESSASTATSNEYTESAGEPYALTFWYYVPSAASDRIRFRVWRKTTGGAWLSIYSKLTSEMVTDTWTSVGLAWDSEYTPGEIYFTLGYVGNGEGSAQVWIDDVTVAGESDVATAEIKAALVSDLEDIDGTGIFSTTLQEVGTEAKGPNDALKPSVYIWASDFEDSIRSLTNMKGECTQEFLLRLLIHSDTPADDMDTLVDDVRNAVQRDTSNILTLAAPKITHIDVSGEGSYFSEEMHANTLMFLLTVHVIYIFSRGEL